MHILDLIFPLVMNLSLDFFVYEQLASNFLISNKIIVDDLLGGWVETAIPYIHLSIGVVLTGIPIDM